MNNILNNDSSIRQPAKKINNPSKNRNRKAYRKQVFYSPDTPTINHIYVGPMELSGILFKMLMF